METAARMENVTIDEWVETAQRHPKKRLHHSGRPAIRADAGDSAGDAGSLPFLCKSHYTRNLIYKCELFEVMAICWEIGHVSRNPQSSRPELLDGDADRTTACTEFPRGESRCRARHLQTCSYDHTTWTRLTRRGAARGASASGAEPAGVRPARDKHPHIFVSLFELRNLFARPWSLFGRFAALLERIRQAFPPTKN